jgi:hypothetical protein
MVMLKYKGKVNYTLISFELLNKMCFTNEEKTGRPTGRPYKNIDISTYWLRKSI